jgi:flagellar hook assembly protein FlgD
VRTLAAGWKPAGAHSISWDGRDSAGVPAPSGVYFCRLSLTDAGGESSATYRIELTR